MKIKNALKRKETQRVRLRDRNQERLSMGGRVMANGTAK
jgi:hypothetical protein